ncbi:hypothetical protein QZM22_00405 [Burkholderia oklahomensis]|uniref:hypothetical protein n=1 Tax=Burkholderia oklahomensis TaxID=342113 RepID=UPI002655A25B|nr:hypothetical protein [Burkholderia oklahomensis]MDN7671023.1 hypothetical protein [Burkholderia oklahomensis]
MLSIEAVGHLLIRQSTRPSMSILGAALSGFGMSVSYPLLALAAIRGIPRHKFGMAIGLRCMLRHRDRPGGPARRRNREIRRYVGHVRRRRRRVRPGVERHGDPRLSRRSGAPPMLRVTKRRATKRAATAFALRRQSSRHTVARSPVARRRNARSATAAATDARRCRPVQ